MIPFICLITVKFILYLFNQFNPNGISQFYQLNRSISVIRVLGGIFNMITNSGDPDQTPRFASALFAYVPQKGRYAYMG